MSGIVFYFSFVLLLTSINFVYCGLSGGFHDDTTKMNESISMNGVKQFNNPEQHELGESPGGYGENNNINIEEYYTFYDKVFWVIWSSFVVYVICVRALTNYRIDYPDEGGTSLISAVISFRKMIAPDPYLDTDMKKLHINTSFENGPVIAISVLWFTLSIFSLDEAFGVNNKHIEDLGEFLIALFLHFIHVVACCIIYDISCTAPMKYYE